MKTPHKEDIDRQGGICCPFLTQKRVFPSSFCSTRTCFNEWIGVIVYIGHVNYLCKLAMYLKNFAYLWILVWIHKDACEYAYGNSEIHFFWVNWGFGFHWAWEFWVWILENNQNYLLFMIKLGIWFPLDNYIGVLFPLAII